MTKGLTLARSFYVAGHNVVGADFETEALICGRVSESLMRFYNLRKPGSKSGSALYIQDVLDIILGEDIDLWVSCSGVASAVEDGETKEMIEARTACKAIQFDVATTQMLHEKHTFIANTSRIGLLVPETHNVTNLSAVETALQASPKGRKYIMKPIGMDDANRADMTLLPRPTAKETSRHLSKLNVSETAPWILQQFIKGPEYCTHSLVVKGQVKAFVACPSAELLMHYEALPSDSHLSGAMLRFTQKYADEGGESFTGHLSFDCIVDQSSLNSEEPALYPIECNPRAHTAVVLFNGTADLAEAYLSLLEPLATPSTESSRKKMIVTPQRADKYYWIGHDLVTLVLLPLLSLLSFQPGTSIVQIAQRSATFLEHVLIWRDGTLEWWDPVPWWWLYHVYWPMEFWNALRSGKKWSRVNVSTTKMFEC